jgi:hypothetical protein
MWVRYGIHVLAVRMKESGREGGKAVEGLQICYVLSARVESSRYGSWGCFTASLSAETEDTST